ncbi:hypothetical protein NIES267_06040 [Calothrix parasitica NIES-267]|uniref:Protein kinase domain-containing protein n=1 Tax=Calothrix parasitica NIES-267 TaxID=1973488 RepID=A0A1Z4LIX4_9CYAN|nr:hypothetical protein NIES267_06040 [Calothrix parasitica NIES-267]
MKEIKDRIRRYFNLSSQIAQLDNGELRSLFKGSGQSSLGWGRTHIVEVGEHRVFVKRIPVTKLEYENLFSTKNLYSLPTYFNYGLGSAGLGAAGLNIFRELIANIKITNWILEGEVANFPFMYHYRIIPYQGKHIDLDKSLLKDFVEYWGNNSNIGNYMTDRANANYELVLFLEYIPYVLETWLLGNPSQLQKTWDKLQQSITFLRNKGIIHFDLHFGNILTDGEQIYLTDFGLLVDKSFALSSEEVSFFEQNRFYDYGEVLRNLGLLIRGWYNSCSEEDKYRIMEKYGFDKDLENYKLGKVLLENIERINADGDIELDKFYVDSIVKYRRIITLIQNFFVEIWGNNRKDTQFPHAELQVMLEDTGFLTSS